MRQLSPVVTIGGGTVIDVKPARHRRRDSSVVPIFEDTRPTEARDEILAAMMERKRVALSIRRGGARTGWIEPEIASRVES